MWKARVTLVDGVQSADIGNTILNQGAGGADVINMSLEREWTHLPSSRADSDTVALVMKPIWSSVRTVNFAGKLPLLMIAAGNSSTDAFWAALPTIQDSYPNHVLVVGANAKTRVKYQYSNWGKRVTMWAPGVAVPVIPSAGQGYD